MTASLSVLHPASHLKWPLVAFCRQEISSPVSMMMDVREKEMRSTLNWGGENRPWLAIFPPLIPTPFWVAKLWTKNGRKDNYRFGSSLIKRSFAWRRLSWGKLQHQQLAIRDFLLFIVAPLCEKVSNITPWPVFKLFYGVPFIKNFNLLCETAAGGRWPVGGSFCPCSLSISVGWQIYW